MLLIWQSIFRIKKNKIIRLLLIITMNYRCTIKSFLMKKIKLFIKANGKIIPIMEKVI